MTSRLDNERLALLVHEVRSPVAALAAIARTFRETPGGDDSRRDLASLALSASLAVERLVREASLTSLRREPFDLGRVASEVVETARLGGARVELRVAPDLPPVDGDSLRLRQALSNLVSNALVHAGPQVQVAVSVERAAEGLRVVVADDGVGIPASDVSRVFEAGVRLDAVRPGSGLGLALVKAIVEAHGGTVGVVSQPGAGASFTILLPTD